MKIIKGMKTKTSYGLDKIPIGVIKAGLITLASPLAHMCTLSLVRDEYPASFKPALVKPLHKGSKKPKDEPASYRPVALLPVISKILEKAAANQLVKFLEEDSRLPDCQH